jgi:hypothetical protein
VAGGGTSSASVCPDPRPRVSRDEAGQGPAPIREPCHLSGWFISRPVAGEPIGADDPVDAGSMTGDACAGIMAEFAAAMQDARRTAPRHLLAGILRVLKDKRRAALAVARRSAANELHGRRRAARLRAVRNPRFRAG